jgi:catechol 2,3-dioxygenase-like lactoylglutathione lyase family enzyme
MSVTLKRIDVVVLFVADLDRAKAFYRDTLGLRMKFEDQVSAGFDFDTTMLLLLNIAGAQDLLSSEAVAVQRPTGASSQLVTFVEDVDAIYTDLVAQGVEFVRKPIDRAWGLRTAHFKDPDGNIWEVAQSLVKDSGEGQPAR